VAHLAVVPAQVRERPGRDQQPAAIAGAQFGGPDLRDDPFGRCRYLGRLGFAVQAFMTAIMLNLKRIVKILTGVGFKSQSTSSV
jgi:hypothetical protein